MMRILKTLFSLLLVAFMALPVYAETITVSAAASLAEAFTEIKNLFEAANPGVTVHTNYAASNPLLRQILEGAPVSLFASADEATMDKARDMIVPGTRLTFAANDLVLITPKDTTAIGSVAELDKAARIAVGNPDSVPAGRYAREALGPRWQALASKIVPGNSVRQVLEYVSRGEVDAGIVYATDARIAEKTVRVAAILSGHTPVTYPLALIKPETRAARDFAAFVTSPEGRGVLQKYGFSNPK